jgi:hypothetical protein
MSSLDSPFVIFSISLVLQCLAVYASHFLRKRRPLRVDERDDFGIVRNAALTLLALIVGFSFSMAVGRYDQRKNYEEAEANAIGTEYVRAGLLPTADAMIVRDLLRRYTNQRISFYRANDEREIKQIGADTEKLQADLWSAVLPAANAERTAVMALAVSGMNDVPNSQGYTQAAWWNRIPVAAWALMGLMAICCNLLVGYGEDHESVLVLLILPLIVSISFWLIADIDSPRGGAIRVLPQNLLSTAQFMKAH